MASRLRDVIGLSALLFPTFFPLAEARQVPNLTLAEHVAQCPLIVTGRITSEEGRRKGTVAGVRYIWDATLEVRSLIKGIPPKPLKIVWSEVSEKDSIPYNKDAIWLLMRPTASGPYHAYRPDSRLPMSKAIDILNILEVEDSRERERKYWESTPPLDIFAERGHELPAFERDFVRSSGKPLKVEREDPKAANEDRPGLYTTYFYPGLRATYYTFPDDGTGFLSDAAIDGSNRKVLWGFGVGASTAAISQRLGAPTSESPEQLEYRLEDDISGAVQIIQFTHAQGRVSKVQWSFIPD